MKLSVSRLLFTLSVLFIPIVSIADDTDDIAILMSPCTVPTSFSECFDLAASSLGENRQGAISLVSLSCDDQNYEACSFLGLLQEEGLAIGKDTVSAIPLYEEACNRQVGSACSRLGYQYALGSAVVADFVRARALTEKSCSLGFAEGCNQLAVLFDLDVEEQNELLLKGCELGGRSACSNLAGRYERGHGLPVSPERAAEFYARSVELGGLGRAVKSSDITILDTE